MHDIRRNRILRPNGTLVPIIRDTLITRLTLEIPRISSDREEGFERFLVKVTLRVLSRMVRHHGWGEGEAGRSNQDAGKLGKEEVWVGLDGIVEATLAEAEEVGVLLGCWLLDSQ